jgi:outer membrane translocation and assembly module TamA
MLNVRQFSLSEDGALPDFSEERVPVRIDMQTLPRQRIRTDVVGMQRLGLGAGAGLVYTNNNLFGMAEGLEIGVKGSFESAPNVREELLRSFEGTVQYSVPQLQFPFSGLNSNARFLNSRTSYGVSVAQVSQLNFTVNANIRFNLKYDVSHSATLSSTLDLIELDWFDASPSDQFRQTIIDEVTDPFQRERILADFSQQINSTIRYTIRSFNTDFIKRNRGSVNEFSIESGGNIPYLYERYVVRPGEPIQGNIPSFTLADSTLSYARYVKGSYDHRRYVSIFDNTVIAWRLFGGLAYAYGETRQIPLNRRFFAGGSNDIRGWPPLRLGPGDVGLGEVTINGGDVKLATFLELRHLLLRNLMSTDWHIAGFADVGNIWYGPRSLADRGRFSAESFYKEAAVGAGFGIRMDWEYLIFRIDVAYKAYDPSVVDGIRRGWFESPDPYIHFGIGHSF